MRSKICVCKIHWVFYYRLEANCFTSRKAPETFLISQ